MQGVKTDQGVLFQVRSPAIPGQLAADWDVTILVAVEVESRGQQTLPARGDLHCGPGRRHAIQTHSLMCLTKGASLIPHANTVRYLLVRRRQTVSPSMLP